jgi:HSP20 family protein
MANLIRSKPEAGEQGELTRRREAEPFFGWDPFGTMRELLRLDPFRELRGFAPARGQLGFVPEFDVKESNDSYTFTADLPGIKESDVEVSITGSTLAVSGKREEEETQEGERYYCCERSYGEFRRSFALPEGADPDSASAEFKDGVLRVVMHKRPEVQPRRVAIAGHEKTGQEKKGKA